MGEFIIWLLIIGIFFMVINSFKPKEKPPEPEKEPDPPPPPPPPKNDDTEYKQHVKDTIAIESLQGKSDEDIIKEHTSVTAEDIKEWKEDLLNNFSRLSKRNEELLINVGQLDMEVKWLRKTCKKFIGDDWKETTGYKYL